MTTRTRPMSRDEARIRATHAHAFLTAAELVETMGDDAGIDPASNIVAALAVLAGIAASDAICGAVRGVRCGENHADAVALLRSCTPPSNSSAAQLKRLLDSKSTAHYSANLLGPARASELLGSARRLTEYMDAVLLR